jgi:3-oxoacyl-[acyl-carrier protein] reductase
VSDHDPRDLVMLVTGGARGIGRSIVLAALARGSRVAFCSRSATAVDAMLGCCDADGRVLGVQADVSSEQDAERLVGEAIAAFGHIDAVINNAGITRDDVLLRATVENWDAVMETNVTGPFLLARAVIPHMVQRSRGAIVSLGSLSANGAPAQAAYAASKAALTGLTQWIAVEFGSGGITAHALVVGYVQTDLTESIPDHGRRFLLDACHLRRSAGADEVAAAALALATGAAPAVNGSTLHVAGGLVDIAL